MKNCKLFVFIALACCSSAHGQEDGFVSLLNGEDLAGWQTVQQKGPDKLGPFKMDKSENAIHVYQSAEGGSKQAFDCLYTEREYSSFVLKLEYKWLGNRFKPREKQDRDAGIMFHVHGDLSQMWPKCVEMQLGDSDPEKTKDRYTSGDLWVIGKDVQALSARGPFKMYNPLLDAVPVGKGYRYDSSFTPLNNENKTGQWNLATVTVNGCAEATFELNGKVVNRVKDMTKVVDGKRVPLSKGRIALQAEWAELMYRNIQIKEISN